MLLAERQVCAVAVDLVGLNHLRIAAVNGFVSLHALDQSHAFVEVIEALPLYEGKAGDHAQCEFLPKGVFHEIEVFFTLRALSFEEYALA